MSSIKRNIGMRALKLTFTLETMMVFWRTREKILTVDYNIEIVVEFDWVSVVFEIVLAVFVEF